MSVSLRGVNSIFDDNQADEYLWNSVVVHRFLDMRQNALDDDGPIERDIAGFDEIQAVEIVVSGQAFRLKWT
jgi:hypothetical protein